MDNPTPEEIKAARQAASLTQAQAGALVHTTVRTWQQWEAGDRAMHPAMWELFCLKTQKPIAAPTDAHVAFEAHFNLSSRQAWKTKDGLNYLNPDIQSKWEGWQAAKGETQ